MRGYQAGLLAIKVITHSFSLNHKTVTSDDITYNEMKQSLWRIIFPPDTQPLLKGHVMQQDTSNHPCC